MRGRDWCWQLLWAPQPWGVQAERGCSLEPGSPESLWAHAYPLAVPPSHLHAVQLGRDLPAGSWRFLWVLPGAHRQSPCFCGQETVTAGDPR